MDSSSGSVPPPPSGMVNNPAWAEDKRAEKEEKFWDKEGKLRGVKLDNEFLWHKVYGFVVAALMIFFTLVFLVSLGAWIFHYVTPWSWLNEEQLSKIQSVIFSGSIGAIVSSYAQKQLGK